MIRTLVRMLLRRLKDRVKDYIKTWVPPESIGHSLSRLGLTSRPSSTWARMTETSKSICKLCARLPWSRITRASIRPRAVHRDACGM